MENMPFDIEAFIQGVAKDHTKEKNFDRLKRVLMNVKSNQGSVTLIPFISKNLGNIYTKMEGVKEYYGETSLIDSGEGWYMILPLEFYKGITPEQIELYNEVNGLYDEAVNLELFDYDTLRRRNYSLFTGICKNHINTDGSKVEEYIDTPCLFVFPSLSPIDALDTAITNKRNVLKDRVVTWLTGIITPNNTGRKGVIQISFKKSDGPGYVSSVTFETNNPDEGVIVIDPNQEFSDEIVSKFNDPIQTFLGWRYDYDNQTYFNETYFREMRDSLKLLIKNANASEGTAPEAEAPNSNGSVDPMKQMPPIPGMNSQSANPADTGLNPNRPF